MRALSKQNEKKSIWAMFMLEDQWIILKADVPDGCLAARVFLCVFYQMRLNIEPHPADLC